MRLDDARPANHCGRAIAALPVRVLLAAEGSRAAVGPRERLGAVVGGVEDDRVVGDTEIVELFEQRPHLPVVLDHAVGIGPEPRHVLRLGFEMGEDVHPGRIKPDEERLLCGVRAFDKIERRVKEFGVDSPHALLGQRPGVLAFLLAPGAEARVVTRRLDLGRDALQDAARAEVRPELGALRIVGVFRLLLGVEVIEVAEELVERRLYNVAKRGRFWCVWSALGDHRMMVPGK
jgi:hypothetical protein